MSIYLKWPVYGLLLLSVVVSPVWADADVPSSVQKRLSEIIPDKAPDSVELSPVSGLYEVSYGAQVFYLSTDGKYIIQGDLLDVDSRKNLTDDRRNVYRKALLGKIDPKTAISFVPKETKHVVYVFTDIDCPYCRRMHSQMADYNAMGIEIRYLAFPRTGIDSPSYVKAEDVWCSEDREATLTKAKSGEKVAHKQCDNPVKSEYELGLKFGVDGTPTLILEDGSVLPGYMEPLRLAGYLSTIGK